jgi:hypothetical protein
VLLRHNKIIAEAVVLAWFSGLGGLAGWVVEYVSLYLKLLLRCVVKISYVNCKVRRAKEK